MSVFSDATGSFSNDLFELSLDLRHKNYVFKLMNTVHNPIIFSHRSRWFRWVSRACARSFVGRWRWIIGAVGSTEGADSNLSRYCFPGLKDMMVICFGPHKPVAVVWIFAAIFFTVVSLRWSLEKIKYAFDHLMIRLTHENAKLHSDCSHHI